MVQETDQNARDEGDFKDGRKHIKYQSRQHKVDSSAHKHIQSILLVHTRNVLTVHVEVESVYCIA